jgi:hypothetical protein
VGVPEYTPQGLRRLAVDALYEAEEALHGGQLFRVGLQGAVWVGEASENALRRADATASEVSCW